MKKLTLALALILCLALCVFAFASCDKGGKKDTSTTGTDAAPAGSTATDAVPGGTTAHVHTPAADFSIDEEATCTYAGSKSKHCTVCDAIIPETVEEIPQLDHTPDTEYSTISDPTCIAVGYQGKLCTVCGEIIESTIVELPIDPTAHNVEEWSATPTLLNPSVNATGECSICHQNVPKTLVYEPPIKTFTSSGVKYKPTTVTLGEVRGEDKHFYPTDTDQDGNDLYVEFNILWNETFVNFDASYMVGHVGGKPFFYLSPAPGAKYADSKFSGTFEWMGHFEIPISDAEVNTPATMCGASDNFSDYPNIAGTDQEHPQYGWHRMGIRVHMELLDGKTGEDLKDYKQIATIYVDGVALCKLSTDPAKGIDSDGTKLFNAAPDEGGIVVFSDMDENTVVPFEISTAKAKGDTKIYIAVDEISVTCGKGFVMPVEKVAAPTADSLEVAEGVNVTTTVWFKLAES